MIRLYLSGGLGNQLFEYATARAVSIRTGAPLEIDLRFYGRDTVGTAKAAWLKDFPVEATFKEYGTALLSPHHPLRRGFEKLILERFREVCFDQSLGYNERVMRLGRNAVLVGFFQCYRYFEQHWPMIAQDIDLSTFVDRAWVTAQEQLGLPWAAIHVRRGDYVGDPRFEMLEPDKYYTNAMALVGRAEPRTRFVVFSDDVAWCQRQSWLDGCEFYQGEDRRHPSNDLATMSRASSNIIGNSSYSWWAAWMGQRKGKIIVAPSTWVDGHRTADLQMAPNHWEII